MGEKRTRLTRNDTIDVLRFVADVAARKADVAAQRQFLVDGLERLAGCDAGFVYSCEDWSSAPGRTPRFASTLHSGAGAQMFAGYAREVLDTHGLAADPFCPATLDRPGPIVTVGIRDALPDRHAHHRHGHFVDYATRLRLGDGVVCFARLPERPERMFGVGLHRADGGRRAVPVRERARVELAIAELAGLIPRGHLPMPEFAADPSTDLANGPADASSRLPPRVREVLGHLLAGRCPKAIAQAMGLSLWTVREYQSVLYRHFGVDGRDELMSRFVR